jgi:hypothetical protein
MNLIKRIVAVISACALLALAGCGKSEPPKPVDRLAAIAQQAAQEAAAQTSDPQEIKMIEWRRELMGKPGLQMYVVFINDIGQPIDYFTTKGKCSSSNKRLTDATALVKGDRGSYHGIFDVPAASEDGTYGQSDEYIYCRTVDGKYKQWNGDYYISDRPIELTIKPLVVNIVTKGTAPNQQQQ